MSSHQSSASETDSWLTPPDLLEAVGGAESFDLDPCAVLDQPWPTALAHLTVEDDGLAHHWDGRVFLNPPYKLALIRRFLARMAAHGRGIALISARTETDHFFQHVFGVATGLLFLRGRLHFHAGADGTYGEVFLRKGERAPFNAGVPSVLVAYGNDDREILSLAPIDGHFQPLRLPRRYLAAVMAHSWRQALDEWLSAQGGPVSLGELYRAFSGHPKARTNRNWRAKLRQTLERAGHQRVEKGVWQRRAA